MVALGELDGFVGRALKLASGRRAAGIAWRLSEFHRIQGSPGLMDALEFLRGELEDEGLSARILRIPADGSTLIRGGYRAPMGWRVWGGRLEVLEPERREVGDFRERPTLVVAHSPPTGGPLEAELVDAGEGVRPGDYGGASGKAALISGRTWWAGRVAAEAGVSALVKYRTWGDQSWFPYEGLWPAAGERPPPAVTVSGEWAARLRSWLSRGRRVVVRVEVEAELGIGEAGILEAEIPGREDVWFLMVAHACHPNPGAHDNASGSAAALEAARILGEISESADMRVGVKVWWVPEFTGTLAALDLDPSLPGRLAGALNLDMVGSDLSRTGGALHVTGFPLYSPGYLPPMVARALEDALPSVEGFEGSRMAREAVNLLTFSGGSDHVVFADPEVGVPQAMVGEWPDRFYHTDGDLPQNLDPPSLGAVAAAAAGVASALSAGDPEAVSRESAMLLAAAGVRDLLGADSEERRSLIPGAYAAAVESLSRLPGTDPSRLGEMARGVEALLGGPAGTWGRGSGYRRLIPCPPLAPEMVRRMPMNRGLRYVEDRRLGRAALHLALAVSAEEAGGPPAPTSARAEVDLPEGRWGDVAEDLVEAGWLGR